MSSVAENIDRLEMHCNKSIASPAIRKFENHIITPWLHILKSIRPIEVNQSKITVLTQKINGNEFSICLGNVLGMLTAYQ